jgi:hypothetical protein
VRTPASLPGLRIALFNAPRALLGQFVEPDEIRAFATNAQPSCSAQAEDSFRAICCCIGNFLSLRVSPGCGVSTRARGSSKFPQLLASLPLVLCPFDKMEQAGGSQYQCDANKILRPHLPARLSIACLRVFIFSRSASITPRCSDWMHSLRKKFLNGAKIPS